MNHLQISKDYLAETEKNEADWLIEEAAAVAQTHALIAIAEQLEKKSKGTLVKEWRHSGVNYTETTFLEDK